MMSCLPVILLHAEDAAAALVQVAHDIAHVLIRHADFHVHNRLKQHRVRVDALLVGNARRRLERHFGGIDRVIAAVVELGAQTRHREARQNALDEVLAQALFDRRNEVARHRTADDRVDELEIRARFGGENSIHTSPNWPWPPLCFL